MKQVVNIGAAPNDGTGDTVRDGGDKINGNFTELYTLLGDGSTLDAATARTNIGAEVAGAAAALSGMLADVAFSGDYVDLLNPPTLFDGVYSSLSGIPATFAPSAHAAAHQNAGGDEISVAGLSGLLADAQTPLAHTHDWADVTGEPTTLAGYGITDGATDLELSDGLATKQATLVSGTNIKTINGSTVLGSGDLVVAGVAADFDSVLTASSTVAANKQRVLAKLSINDGGGILVIEDTGILCMV